MFLFALIVLVSAVVIVFLDEIIASMNTIFKNPNKYIVLPVALASSLVVAYNHQLQTLLILFQLALQEGVATILSFKLPALGGYVLTLGFLFGLASFPAYSVYAIIHFKFKSWGDARAVATRVYGVSWVFLMMLWIN
jgi:hypothetical protein